MLNKVVTFYLKGRRTHASMRRFPVKGKEERLIAPPWPLLAVNAQGEAVKSIQHFLDALGQNLTVDGGFGPLTQGGVEAFQSARGLGVDGVVGPQTWPALVVQTAEGGSGEGVKAPQS